MSSRSGSVARTKSTVHKDSSSRSVSRRASRDSTDTFGIRGAGASWQASFGMALNERDLLFSVRREPVAWRLVFQVAHDVFDKGFTVEEIAEKPDPNWSREVSKVLDDLNAKAVYTQMSVFERLFGWAIAAVTYLDWGQSVSEPVSNPKEIRIVYYQTSPCRSVAWSARCRFGLAQQRIGEVLRCFITAVLSLARSARSSLSCAERSSVALSFTTIRL